MRRRNPDKLKLRDMDVPMVLGVELDRKTLIPVRRPLRSITPDIPAAAPAPIMDIPLDPAPHTGLMSDLRSLSSGTLAGLFKTNDMAEVDRQHIGLLTFYVTNFNPVWKTWIEIWKDYNVYTAAGQEQGK